MNDRGKPKNWDNRSFNSIITFQHLRYALAAAHYGSFRRGAESLLVRQSTLSRCIRQLEHSIGITIFERSSGGVRATKAGLNFLRMSRSILQQVVSLVESSRRYGDGKAGQLAIGFGLSLSTGNLRETLIDHLQRFPQIEIDLLESYQTRLVTALLNGEIDVVILTGEQAFPDCGSMRLWNERILVALPEGHGLVSRQSVDWKDLQNDTIVLSQYDLSHGPDDLAVLKVGPADYRAKIKRHDVNRDTIQYLVSMGFGLSLVNESDIAAGIAGIVYRQVRDGIHPSHMEYSAYWRGDNENPALTGFLKLLAARYPSAIA
jgi:DNA-binding transcriptional LysR family regulator